MSSCNYDPEDPVNLPKREDWDPARRGGHSYEEGVKGAQVNLIVSEIADACEGFSDSFHEFFDDGDPEALERWAGSVEEMLAKFRRYAR